MSSSLQVGSQARQRRMNIPLQRLSLANGPLGWVIVVNVAESPVNVRLYLPVNILVGTRLHVDSGPVDTLMFHLYPKSLQFLYRYETRVISAPNGQKLRPAPTYRFGKFSSFISVTGIEPLPDTRHIKVVVKLSYVKCLHLIEWFTYYTLSHIRRSY
jgi:hypothetical protein